MRKHDGTGKCVCAVCGEHRKRLGVHIKVHGLTPKEYYDKYIRKSDEGICPTCGKETTFINIEQGYHKFCSLKCSSESPQTKEKVANTIEALYGDSKFRNKEKARQTTIERYGVPNFRNTEKSNKTFEERYGGRGWASPQIKEKFDRTVLEKYGCESTSQSNAVREKFKKTCLEKYGVDNPAKCLKVTEKALNTRIERYGIGSPDIVVKIKETKLKRYGTDTYNNRKKASETCEHLYGVVNPGQMREAQQKAALTRKRTSVAADGTLLDSSWEKAVYDFCILNHIPIERNVPIYFELNGEKKVTFIDFKIDGMLFEIKAKHLLNGCFDYDKKVTIDEKLAIYREYQVCLITDYRELFEDKNLGIKGIDIGLFTNLTFPTLNNDRPECFYKVKVNRQISIYDAFFNDSIRWEMIKNRLKYSNEFIDAKQVLRALNVTRRYKQPSWFSKSFAKNIIKKYITSDTIVDPFAGWGTRCDASIELNRKYIGCDLNEELVRWHQQQNRNIILMDAKNFIYNDKCSVFICPPYGDSEIYFDAQDTRLFECDWLKIVMKNIPNAAEYVMVCKNVTDEFKKYIVEEKINKSHFGSNTEYILKITNKREKEGDTL